jgi:peptide-N4-(N-acetyl-beta-glucosaminyl)asparagine amidase
LEDLEIVEGEDRIVAFTHWFKEEFFAFFPFQVPCRLCRSPTTQRAFQPVISEKELDGAPTKVEVYHCDICGAKTRFVRYSKVTKLLETRIGRCEELVNVFCAMLGLFEIDGVQVDARTVVDSTGHIWAEYWSEERGRYVHVDPCENLVDRPYVYEEGWGKRLEWVCAISQHQCVDVTKKYTRRLPDVLQRRGQKVDEDWWRRFVAFKSEQFATSLDEDAKAVIDSRQTLDECSVEEMSQRQLEPEELRPRTSGRQT